MTNPKQHRQEILAKIKSRAESLGVKHEDIADKMGIKQPTVTRMLNGKWAVKLDNVISLAWAVGMDVEVKESTEGVEGK